MLFLKRPFFERPTIDVAQDLLGKVFVWEGFHGFITETEAYVGQDDPACHGARGLTPRTKVMFGPAGFAYVYLIYGMYHCLNIVTEQEGFPAAVLIRGIHLIKPEIKNLNGPGKVCRHLQINRSHNQIDLTQSLACGIQEAGHRPSYHCTPRIGISKGQEKLWRFVIKESASVLECVSSSIAVEKD